MGTIRQYIRFAACTGLIISGLACVDRLNIPIEDEITTLVVEGYVTTQPRRHRIKLSYSAKYGTIFEGTILPVQGANVSIRDESGAQVRLEEGFSGFYFTPIDYRVRVGVSYTLIINTAEQENYVSLPQKVPKVSPIDSITLRYRKMAIENDVLYDHGIEVYAEFKDPVEETNYYMWRNKGTYFVITDPEDHEPPLDCCATCYVDEDNADQQIYLADDRTVAGQRVTKLVAYIRDDGKRYDEQYELRLSQLGITKSAYNYFDLLNQQLQISGSIFDPPPATVGGNMINLDDSDDQPIGFFVLADEFVDTTFISRDLLQGKGRDFYFPDDCRKLPRSTTKRPDNW